MYKQKLIDLLKSDEEVKTAMEKLEFGCIIEYKGKQEKILSDYNNRYTTQTFFANADSEYINKYCKIIGLPLQERFIRMYCEGREHKDNIKFIKYKQKGKIISLVLYGSELREYIEETGEPEYYNILCELDNTKDFSEQSDEVYKSIFLALTKYQYDKNH